MLLRGTLPNINYSNCYCQRQSLAIFRLILSPLYDSDKAEILFMLPDCRRYYSLSNPIFFVSSFTVEFRYLIMLSYLLESSCMFQTKLI